MSKIVARIRSWNRARRDRRRARRGTLRIPREADTRAFLAVMGIVKNEALNIDEWIGHYLWQGADHIFLIDNGSTDDTVERISRWVEGGRVTLVSRPEKYKQTEHYQAVYRDEHIRARFRWLLVADADEFWFSPTEGGVAEALTALDEFDLVYCRWTIFGCSGQDNHPTSLRKDLIMREPRPGPHEHSKWVAKTSTLDMRNANQHRVFGVCSSRTVTEGDSLRLNHYQSQSREFWGNVKMTRGDVHFPTSERMRSWAEFDSINAACTVEDRTLADMVEAAGPAAWGRGG